MKHKILTLNTGWSLALFVLLDAFCIGLGMGVPFFCILLGLPTGVFLVLRAATRTCEARQLLSKTLWGAALTAGITALGMLPIWSHAIGMLFDPTADLANFGIPQLLYEPLASFIGWLVLMIVISPFLQFLMTLFGAHLALLRVLPRHGESS